MEPAVIREIFERAGEALATVPGNIMPPGGYFNDLTQFLTDVRKTCSIASSALAAVPTIKLPTQDAKAIATNSERVRGIKKTKLVPDRVRDDGMLSRPSKPDGDCNC